MNFVVGKDPVRAAEVYRLLDASGATLYVGWAYDAGRRCLAHKYTKPWWPEVAGRKVARYAARDIADGVEAIIIVTERPRYNYARQNDAGLGDQSWQAAALGIGPEEACLVSAVRRAVPAPARVASVIGVEAGALSVHDWRVYGRRGVPEWGIASWDCPRPGSPLSAVGDAPPRDARRLATEQESRGLGVAPGATLDVCWYMVADQFDTPRAVAELVRPRARSRRAELTDSLASSGWNAAGASVSAWPA